MKKLALLLIALSLILASCEVNIDIQPEPEPETPTHNHTWNEGYFTVIPTCQTDGERIYTCTTCQETKTEVVKASEEYHNFGNGIGVNEPTCTEKGLRHFVCALCGAEKDIEIDALGHLWDNGKVTKEATDSEDGIITYSCQREGCDATKEETFHKHQWGEGKVSKPATCSIDGEMTYTCSVCGETKTEVIPADGVSHTFSPDWYNNETHHWHLATCCILPMAECDGYAEHTYGEPTILVPATCTTEGTREKTCTVCGYKVTETYTDADTHEYSEEWTTDENQHWHVVSCGHEVTVTKENHTFDEGVETVQGDCHTDGRITYTCSVCGYTYTEDVPKEEYHDVDTSTNTCKTCNEVFYFQAQYTANQVKVTLRAAFVNAGLTDLVIPEYVPNYNYSRWYKTEVINSVNTSTLESITIPEGATTIAYQAFRGKANLHTVNLPDTITTIDQEAFMECTALESIRIPASVTFIGAQGFAYCTNLKDIYFDGTNAQWAAILTGAKNILSGTSATVHCSDD